MTEFDTIVIGAGIEGSATAYELQKSGLKTLLLEQFPLPHSRGSSHGHSRIIRKAYAELFYSQMMVDAYAMWKEMEEQIGSTLIRPSGLLTVHKGRNPSMIHALDSTGSGYRELNAKEMCTEFPMLHYSDEYNGIYDYSGGIIRADRALSAYQTEFIKNGGTIRDEEKITEILPSTSSVLIASNKQKYRAKKVVLAAGPWTNKLTEPLGLKLPLKPVHIAVWYWRKTKPGHLPCMIMYSPVSVDVPMDIYALPEMEYQNLIKTLCIGVYFWRDRSNSFSEVSGFPAFSEFPPDSPSSCGIYLLPAYEYPGLCKVCLHNGIEIDPDARDLVDPKLKEPYLEAISSYIQQHMPGLESTPSISESCIYTMTPDENFILDTHPSHKNLIIAAGFSGHGFKLAPVVGRILTELALDEPNLTYDLSPFKISRFSNLKTSKL